MGMHGYEAQETSKEQTEMPRFTKQMPRNDKIYKTKGPGPFVLCSYTMDELCNQKVSIG